MEKKMPGWGRKGRRDPWLDVHVNASAMLRGDFSPESVKRGSEISKAIFGALQECFRDGPEAAARAQSEWTAGVRGAAATDWTPPFPPYTRHEDRWNRFLSVVLDKPEVKAWGDFRSVDIEFGPTLRRNHGRGRSV
jgi:hypothetical protein